jgi:hypothetical protein
MVEIIDAVIFTPVVVAITDPMEAFFALSLLLGLYRLSMRRS